MEKQYRKISKKTGFPPQGVHLVHHVIVNMREACVFPPKPDGTEGSCFYSALNICSALIAYLNRHHGKDPWGTLRKFGFESSSEVGKVALAILDNPKVFGPPGLNLKEEEFEELFEHANSDRLRSVKWLDGQWAEDRKPEVVHKHLAAHFPGVRFEELVVNKRRFPEHVRADLQLALNQVFERYSDAQLLGANPKHSHDGLDFRSLTERSQHHEITIGPLEFLEVQIGAGDNVRCLANGLWLAHEGELPFVVVLGKVAGFNSRGVQIELATIDSEPGRKLADQFFENLRKRVEDSRCYRGKILSFEVSDEYSGNISAVKVHDLKRVTRDEVILPKATIDLLDRNIIDFVQQRPELLKRGMNLKKGLLFFGPPGTGKTHTVHYLSRALPGTTTLIVTAEQIGFLSRYMTLARLLQPSLVIIEDADLIARQRERMGTCEEVLLNKLLNEMDGLRSDSEVIFVLTTNRPEALEEALTARPGRIDQAIEFPLPNDEGREKLARLYAGNQAIDDQEIDAVVSRTENTSAAFIKELMRRATQYAIVRGSDKMSVEDIETAAEEMFFSGGAFNRRILGGADE